LGQNDDLAENINGFCYDGILDVAILNVVERKINLLEIADYLKNQVDY